MKIVLDTNIVLSGLLQSQGNPAQVLTLALAGAVQVCPDERILAEYAEVLARPRFNAVALRIHGKGQQGVKPRAEVVREILAGIRERRA